MKSCRKSLLVILFFTFALSCKISENNETEPNNTFTDANQIEINKEITGFIESENDTDNYFLDIDEEQILKIELSGIKGVNHSINIFKNENTKPQLIKVIDDNRKSSSETFANLFVQPGRYLFNITHGSRDIKKGNTETSYKLLVTTRSYLNEEKEPNDNPYAANEITDTSIASGYFSPAQNSLNNDQKNRMKEEDWYKFNVNISDSIPALIDLSLTGVNGVDSTITILNSAMEEILTVDSAAAGEGENITDFGVKESGVYYIRISSKNFLFSHDTPYELKLDYKIYDQNSELESNNSFEKANIIKDNIVNGRINGLDDLDYYQFIPPFKNKYYKAGCSSVEGLDIIMIIYDNNRNKIFEINNAGAGEAEKIPYFMVKNPIYIAISASALSAIESKYTLDIEKFESSEVIEIEPNNTKTTANLFNDGITGFINYKNDIDFYLLKYEDRQKVKISARGIKDGKIKISTTDQLGFIIKSKEIVSDEETSFIEIFDRKGYIIVESIVPNYEFPYLITVEEL
jgi:hypothetical protein